VPSSETGAAHGADEIPWRRVQALVEWVLDEAERRGVRVAVAVTDRWGRQLAFQRQPGTVIASSAVAVGKALSAVTFDSPTQMLLDTITRHDQEELGRVNPGLVFAAGGLPIRTAGLLLGGLGVSGASAEEDAELALGALAHGGFDSEFREAR
jgi:uncharacterized protein GlcG (DUF336 family)